MIRGTSITTGLVGCVTTRQTHIGHPSPDIIITRFTAKIELANGCSYERHDVPRAHQIPHDAELA